MGNENSSSQRQQHVNEGGEWQKAILEQPLIPLDKVELTQLESGQGGHEDDEDDEEEGTEQRVSLFGAGSAERLFATRSDFLTEGLVVADTRFKVTQTQPRGVLGRFVGGKTKVQIKCSFSSSSDNVKVVEKVLLVPVKTNQQDSVDASSLTKPDFSELECVNIISGLLRRVSSSRGKLHVVEGQAIFGGRENIWMIVKACQPPQGYLSVDTEFHFETGEELIAAERVRLVPVADTLGATDRVAVNTCLREYLQGICPLYVEPRGTVFVPIFKDHIRAENSQALADDQSSEEEEDIQRSDGEAGLSRAEIVRKARLSYFEQETSSKSQLSPQEESHLHTESSGEKSNLHTESPLDVSEVEMVEWRVMELDGAEQEVGNRRQEGAVIVAGTNILCEGEAMDRDVLLNSILAQNRTGRSGGGRPRRRMSGDSVPTGYTATPITGARGGDRCMRCGALVSPPVWFPAPSLFLGGSSNMMRQRPPMIYRCPCGQPLANSRHPMWQSVDRMSQDVSTATRPSVVFLQELREVIGIMPMADPRSTILHSSLRVFPMRSNLELDFNAADNLVLMIVPTLERRRGVDQQVLSRLPVSTYSAIQECAGRRKETECCICMEPYDTTEALRTLPCFHFFHKDCIDRWLGTSKVCPVCKFQVE